MRNFSRSTRYSAALDPYNNSYLRHLVGHRSRDWGCDLELRVARFQAIRAVQDSERDRVAVLNAPPPKNPPALLAPATCLVLKAFCTEGRRREPGEIVTLTAFDAGSMAFLGRVKILS